MRPWRLGALACGASVLALLALRRRWRRGAKAPSTRAELGVRVDALSAAALGALAEAHSQAAELATLSQRLGGTEPFVDAPSSQSLGPPPAPSAAMVGLGLLGVGGGPAPIQRSWSTESLLDLNAFETPPEGGAAAFPSDESGAAAALLRNAHGERVSADAIERAVAAAEERVRHGKDARLSLAQLGSALPWAMQTDGAHGPTLRALLAQAETGQAEGSGGSSSSSGGGSHAAAELSALRRAVAAALCTVARSRLLLASASTAASSAAQGEAGRPPAAIMEQAVTAGLLTEAQRTAAAALALVAQGEVAAQGEAELALSWAHLGAASLSAELGARAEDLMADAMDSERLARLAATHLPRAPGPLLALGAAGLRAAQLSLALGRRRQGGAQLADERPGDPASASAMASVSSPALAPETLPAPLPEPSLPLGVCATLRDAQSHFAAAAALCSADGDSGDAAAGGASLGSALLWQARAALGLAEAGEATQALGRLSLLPSRDGECVRAQELGRQLQQSPGLHLSLR